MINLKFRHIFSFYFFLSLTGILSSGSIAQDNQAGKFEYLSPLPQSKYNLPETNIIIRYGQQYNIDRAPQFQELVKISGTKSGIHTGKIIFSEKSTTLIFKPDKPFTTGETVTVNIDPLPLKTGFFTPPMEYRFFITKENVNQKVRADRKKYLKKILPELNLNSKNTTQNIFNSESATDSLPEDFPVITVSDLDSPAEGFLFFTPFTIPDFSGTYLVISDNYGVPVFYKKVTAATFGFKLQKNGTLTYYDNSVSAFLVLDSSYSVIDTIRMRNGYSTDLHELLVFENNHAMLMSYDWQRVNMDTIVPGGDTNALVVGLVIQELDENENVVFQWRSWDHFQITDATYDISLTDSTIDYVHGNALEPDYDGNILLSSRHMDEITKINRQTGDIIWRWGGEYCENNQFVFVNDPLNGFSHQHDIRRLANGNLTLFDNGNLHDPQVSRALEYQVDEVNKIAVLIADYRNEPSTYSYAMGSFRRLENHNSVIGWGAKVSSPDITEVNVFGEVQLAFTMADTIYNYRAYKNDWATNIFMPDKKLINFGYVSVGDEKEMSFTITNFSKNTIEINSSHNRLPVYSLVTTLPVTIPAGETESFTIRFSPVFKERDYFDELHLRQDTDSVRISAVINLQGSSDPNFVSVEDDILSEFDFSLEQNYPNPFNPVTTIRYSLKNYTTVSLRIYDILGNEVSVIVDEEQPAGNYEVKFDGSKLASGIYFYRLRTDTFTSTKKLIILR